MAMQGQERVAFETGKADGIFGRPYNNPYDQAVVPKSYSFYDQGFEEGSGSTIPPRGPAGPQGEDGEQGPGGPTGATGVDGIDGLSFLQGAGPPASGLGKQGDSYYDTTTSGDFYLKTDGTTWILTARLGDLTLAVQTDDTGGSPAVLYKGEALPGALTSAAAWRVQQVTTTTDGGGNDDIAVLWADGDTLMNNVWDNRLALSYS